MRPSVRAQTLSTDEVPNAPVLILGATTRQLLMLPIFFLTFISSGVLGGALLMPKKNKTEWYYLVSTHFGTIAAHTNPSLMNPQIHISYRPIHGGAYFNPFVSKG